MRAKNLTLKSVFVLKKKKLFIAHVLPTKPKKLNFGRSFENVSIQYSNSNFLGANKYRRPLSSAEIHPK